MAVRSRATACDFLAASLVVPVSNNIIPYSRRVAPDSRTISRTTLTDLLAESASTPRAVWLFRVGVIIRSGRAGDGGRHEDGDEEARGLNSAHGIVHALAARAPPRGSRLNAHPAGFSVRKPEPAP